MSFTADSLTLPILELAKASSPLILRLNFWEIIMMITMSDDDYNDDDNYVNG